MLALAPRNLDLSRSAWGHSPSAVPRSEAPQFSLELFEGLYGYCCCVGWAGGGLCCPPNGFIPGGFCPEEDEFCCIGAATCRAGCAGVVIKPPRSMRSEEHTSE